MVSLKITFPKHDPNVPVDPLSVEAGNHENSSLRPVLRRSSTAPANCSTCISAWNLRWSFQPFGVGFLDPINPNLKMIYLPKCLTRFCLSTVSFQHHLVLVEPYLSFAGFVYPLDTGIRAGLFQQLQPIAHALNESIQKTMEQMSSHSFENKGKSCKFSGRVFLFPPEKIQNKKKRSCSLPATFTTSGLEATNQTINRSPPSLGRFFFPPL